MPDTEHPIIRNEIVTTAIKFLQNPNVIDTPLAQKQKFLQRKGLSDEEIKLACEGAGSFAMHDSQVPAVPAPLHYQHFQVVGFFERFKEIVHNLGVIGVVAYAVYLFYKKFIKPYLFGGKGTKSMEDTVNDLNTLMSCSIEDLKESISSIKVEIDQLQRENDSNTQRQLYDLKSEINTVKGLLLSRKQFSSVSNTLVVPPSIPAWQLLSIQQDPDPDPDPDTADTKSEDLMEIISGDGSEHEHEHVNKTTSESSLEIM